MSHTFLTQKVNKDEDEALESSDGTNVMVGGRGVRGGGQRQLQRGGCAVPCPRRQGLKGCLTRI